MQGNREVLAGLNFRTWRLPCILMCYIYRASTLEVRLGSHTCELPCRLTGYVYRVQGLQICPVFLVHAGYPPAIHVSYPANIEKFPLHEGPLVIG